MTRVEKTAFTSYPQKQVHHNSLPFSMDKKVLRLCFVLLCFLTGIAGCKSITNGCDHVLSYQIGDKEYDSKQEALVVAQADIDHDHQLMPGWYRSELKATCLEYEKAVLLNVSYSYEARVRPEPLLRLLSLGLLVGFFTTILLLTLGDGEGKEAKVLCVVAISVQFIALFFWLALRLFVYFLMGEHYYVPLTFVLFVSNALLILACPIVSMSMIYKSFHSTRKGMLISGTFGIAAILAIIERIGVFFTLRDIWQALVYLYRLVF
ncbi:MAG: hypothetical protein WBK08_15455 [Nitrospira sp.]